MQCSAARIACALRAVCVCVCVWVLRPPPVSGPVPSMSATAIEIGEVAARGAARSTAGGAKTDTKGVDSESAIVLFAQMTD